MESNTVFFNKEKVSKNEVRKTIDEVYAALKEKGYNPTSQLVGYIMSGDPTYITSHNGARTLITKVDRDEIVEELFNYYIETACEEKSCCENCCEKCCEEDKKS